MPPWCILPSTIWSSQSAQAGCLLWVTSGRQPKDSRVWQHSLSLAVGEHELHLGPDALLQCLEVKELVCHHLDSCCSRTQTQAAWHWLPKEDLPRATDKHSSTSTYRIVFNAYEKWFKSYCLQCIVSQFNDYISSLRLRIRPSGLKNKFIFSTLEARSLKSKYWYSLVSS